MMTIMNDRDADSASCRVAELVSQELPQLLLTIDSIILSSVSQFKVDLVCSFFLNATTLSCVGRSVGW